MFTYTTITTLADDARPAVALVALRARGVEVEPIIGRQVRITGRRARVIAALDSRLIDAAGSVIERA